MPPKDVKSAKKLYSKLKKEKQLSKEHPSTADANDGVSKENNVEESETTNNTEKVSEVDSQLDSKDADKQESTKDDKKETILDSSGAEKESKDEPKEAPKEKLKEEPKDDTTKDKAEEESEEKPKEDPKEQPKEVEPEEEPEEEPNVSNTLEVNEQSPNAESSFSSEESPKYGNETVEDSTGQKKSETQSEPDAKILVGKDAEDSNELNDTDLSNRSNSSDDKEIIADLRNENETLKQQISLLEGKIAGLENELAALKISDGELSLSPIEASENTYPRRNRVSSFVEADLYSEVDKVSSRSQQMDKWVGYQLDMTKWKSGHGIGRIVTF